MRKTKKDYYGNLNEKDEIDNKRFWKIVKPFLSDKLKSSEKTTLVHKEKIIPNDDEKTKFNLFFFYRSTLKHLKIPEFKDTDFAPECISRPALKAIMKFRNHPSVSAIRNAFKPNFQFLKSKC